MLDRLDRDGTTLPDQEETGTIGGDDPLTLATVKEDGKWYVSALLHGAPSRPAADAGLAAPDPDKATPAVGADSPEAAVKDLLAATADLDVERLIELTPPDRDGRPARLRPHPHRAGRTTPRTDSNSSVKDFNVANVTLEDLQFESKNVAGGTKILPTKHRDRPRGRRREGHAHHREAGQRVRALRGRRPRR